MAIQRDGIRRRQIAGDNNGSAFQLLQKIGAIALNIPDDASLDIPQVRRSHLKIFIFYRSKLILVFLHDRVKCVLGGKLVITDFLDGFLFQDGIVQHEIVHLEDFGIFTADAAAGRAGGGF